MIQELIQNSIDEDNKQFWEFVNKGEFKIQRCNDCESYRFPSSYICSTCHSTSTTWSDVSGEGEVQTFTVIRKVYHQAFKNKVPYNLSVIRLNEGVQTIGNVESLSEIRIGMKVKVTLEDIDENHKIPKFVPVRSK